jgi:hypothetical protein
MINFRCWVVLILFISSICGHLNASNHHNKAYRNFWHPTFLSKRLAYCTVDGAYCGKAVADRYCQILGYDYSSQNVIAHNVGLTHYLDSRARCKGWSCNGFVMIGCAVGISHIPPKPYHYSEKRFADPRYHGYRVDWCYEANRGCGLRAANSFCSRIGYMQAKHFVMESQVSATRTIGSQQLCFGTLCNAFKEIICYR